MRSAPLPPHPDLAPLRLPPCRRRSNREGRDRARLHQSDRRPRNWRRIVAPDLRHARSKGRRARASCRRDGRLRFEIGAASQRLHPQATCPLPDGSGDEASRKRPLSLLNAGRLDGVVLMSPRTAAIFAALVVRHDAVTQASRLDCISAAVAQAVEPLKARAIVAARPREEDILALISPEAASS